MTENERLYAKAMKAIQDLFEDTSVSIEDTKFALNGLIQETKLLIESLE